MLVPPVAQGATGGRQVGDTVGARGQQSSVPSAPATLWPLAPAQHNQATSQQSQATPPLATTPAPAHNQGVSRYGLYSLFPGGGGASYVAATPATPCTTSARAYHATTHKVSESVFSAAVGVGVGGYTWGAPTPPPGSPYSPVPVTQLELLAKNLASLAPHHGTGQAASHQAHQALSLQGAVGVNVATASGTSLHHAQHTQHTLNLAGIHHLHHGESTMTTTSATSFTSKFIDDRTISFGGLHQNAFSPQLSLMTAGTPAITINSFSSPTNSQTNVMPTTGMLLQSDYHNPTQAITSTVCPTTVNVSTIPSGGSTTSVSTMLVQAGQTGHTSGGYVQHQTTSCSSTKKLDNFGNVHTTMTGQTVKLEKTRQSCICRNNTGKTKLVHSDIGCSRTLPVVSSWNGQQEMMTSCTSNSNNVGGVTTTTGIANLVKREPMATVPCQVAEVSTSLHATTTAVKIEPMPPKSENGIVVSTAGAGGIPVGIAVARQRLQHQETTSSSMRNVSLSHHTSHHASYHHFQPDSLGPAAAMTMGGATLVHCGPSGDDRPAHLAIPSGTLAPSLNAALGSTLHSGMGSVAGNGNHPGAPWPPTIWQYPTAAMPSMEPVGFPQMGVGLQSGLQGGLQLVRDPTTGHLLLIHAAEQMQQAVVWPNYPSHNGGSVGPPPLLLPPPPQPPSLQLLSDMGGARLVLTDNKRKQQNAMPMVKIEADCGNIPTTIIASAESSKTLQTVSSVAGTLMPDAPLLTTLHYYPHAPALVQISQAEPTHCTSQQRNTFLTKATSPVSCLTPPPEVTTMHAIEPPQTTPIGVQDASNQTDGLETDDEPLIGDTYVKQEQYSSPCHQQVMTMNPTNFDFVSSSHDRPRMQFGTISTTNNSTMDQTTGIDMGCDVIGKFEKTGTTIVNSMDCTRYATTTTTESVTTITKCSQVSSIDRTIESVVSCRSTNDDKITDDENSLNVDDESTCDDRISRIGTRVIEITEENCDSFHENLEFFGRRRDPVEQVRKPYFTEEMLNEQRALEEKRNERTDNDDNDVVDEISGDDGNYTETPVVSINAEITLEETPCVLEKFVSNTTEERETNFSITSQDYRMEVLNVSRVDEEQESMGVKSFDMPSIDCDDDRETQKIVVKRESACDAIVDSDDCTLRRNDASNNAEKTNRQERKQSVERHHPGIENVVEKLKKNAAAALHDHQTCQSTEEIVEKNLDVQRSRNNVDVAPRKCDNGLKKLILRSCEKSMSVENFSSSEIANKYSTVDVAMAKTLSLTDNNNDSNSNNNNIKITDDVANNRQFKRTKLSSLGTTTFDDGSDDTFVSKNEIDVHDAVDKAVGNDSGDKRSIAGVGIGNANDPVEKLKNDSSKPRQNVDLSGLELLSNSIEQFEHLKPGNSQNGGQENLEDSTTETETNCQPQQQAESNNNDVDSPLGLLCALAEQRFMEEVAVIVPKRPRENLDNSEEISQAGTVLMNLGKVGESNAEEKRGEKRKIVANDEDRIYGDSKRICEDNGQDSDQKRESPEQYFDRIGKARRFVAKSKEHSMKIDLTDQDVDASAKNVENTEKIVSDVTSREADVETEFTDSDVDNCDEVRVCPLRIAIPSAEFDMMNDAKMMEDDRANDPDWPNMDAMELDMRVRMASIQRQYREKQKELSKLPTRKNEKRSPGRPRKKSHCSSDYGSLEPDGSPPKSPLDDGPDDSELCQTIATMPKLSMPRCNVNLVKLGEPKSHIKLLHSIPSIPIPVPTVASPITVLPTSKLIIDDEDKNLTAMGYETSSPAPTVASSSSASKKRKVGRPRKLMCTSGSARHLTETIVAKKPKSKSSLVGYLVTSKNRHIQNKFVGKSVPMPYKTGLSGPKNSKSHKIGKSKIKPAKQTPLHSKNVISSIIAEKAKLSQEAKQDKQVTKVKPKLKAEAKVKVWEDEESGEWNYTIENIPPEVAPAKEEISAEIVSEPSKEVAAEEETDRDRPDKTKKKKRKSTSASPTRRKSGEHEKRESKKRKSSTDCKECKECAKAARAERMENIVNKCKLTSSHLSIEQFRVLTAMGGLFYAGRLSAVQAPDVYAITLDGERGNRPHIHSREEILRDAIVEVCPASTKELTPGTRLCAYWSQQYRCLYPGTSVEPSEPDSELDEKFVSVEFDDGDSGRIALDDIRLLQPDYPVVEYDPNPLLTLGKRRRQTSTCLDEKRSSSAGHVGETQSSTTVANSQTDVSPITDRTTSTNTGSDVKSTVMTSSEDADARILDEYRERKRLKKRRRDKLKRLQDAQEGKKKHRRHKCCEEHRKHKHRKHRKHKHRHSHHSSYSEGSHVSGGDSCGGQKSEEEGTPDDSPSRDEIAVADQPPEEASQAVVEEEERLDEPVVDSLLPEETAEKPKKSDKKSKARERQESVESRSKMAAFLPARQLWGWAGKGYRRPGAKGRAKKQFFRSIQRGSETIQIGDSAVFLSTGRPDRPYIGRIESMWETSSSNMIVKVKWFYHPEETVGCPANLKYPGALFESPHMDENDVQTISHKCEVLPLADYTEKLGKEPHRYLTIYDNNDIYYLAGYYDPTTHLLTMQPGVV